MRVLVAGATGAVGRALVPELLRRGHEVFGTTRKLGKAPVIGAQLISMNGLDEDEVLSAVRKVKPDAIVHQMTSLTKVKDLKYLDREFEQTNQLRTLGTRFLLDAARQVGTRHFVVQSFTGWPNAREGGPVKTEADPLDATPPPAMSHTLAAIRKLERTVLEITDVHAVALRYGAFYGPGTSIASGGDVVEMIRQRKLPIVGDGGGVWSFVHIADAAAATAQAIESGSSGLYNIVDDEPAPVRVWLPELAVILGAKPPRHVPSWIARWAIGESGVSMMTRIRGSSNEKAKRLLGWTPANRTWRDGFRREFGALQSR